ncbi:MAG: DnaJ domain-containing protein, partial [Gammaproteobacteria bacterium]|nr:DnaJ domain-containing protein [Gammaproteobacteria bacterium]
MPVNTLLPIIREIIETQPSGISEYDLMVKLQKNEAMIFNDIDPGLVLFRKHFLIMHTLYQMQTVFFNEGWYLSISPLAICLEPLQESGLTDLPAERAESKIRDYYLDWNNFEVTEGADVDKLLAGFWEHFLAVDKRMEALQTLELPADAVLSTVKHTYRRLAREYHPDKGGDAARFREIREAYETLLRSGLK